MVIGIDSEVIVSHGRMDLLQVFVGDPRVPVDFRLVHDSDYKILPLKKRSKEDQKMHLTLAPVKMGTKTIMSQDEEPCAGSSEDIDSSSDEFYWCIWKYLSEKYACFTPKGDKKSCDKETKVRLYEEFKDVHLKGYKHVRVLLLYSVNERYLS